MKRLLVLFAAIVLTLNTNARPFSAVEESQIQTILYHYLLSHPEILLQVSQELQKNSIKKGAKKHCEQLKRMKRRCLIRAIRKLPVIPGGVSR